MHVPGWHEATSSLRGQNKVRMAGIIEEQHPDRARLFMQWKRMDWPLLVDSLNLLEVTAVPITLFIDEHGIIRKVNPPLKEAAKAAAEFAATSYPAPGTPARTPGIPAPARDFLWGGEANLSSVIAAYTKMTGAQPNDAPTHFRLGVAHRRRYDSRFRHPDDFQEAVEQWQQALDLDPNQYIWRRRIQQYGPRLDKPYPFYDWVPQARQEIQARGETPAPLAVEPGGAEFAKPLKGFQPNAEALKEPAANKRIHRDKASWVTIETVAVPAAVKPGGTVRLHAAFRPRTDRKAHWNNEAEGLVIWVKPPEGWVADATRIELDNPPGAVSQEVRRVEFEAKAPANTAHGTAAISGYALYYVCEDVRGTCLYRRQDITFPLKVVAAR